MFLHESFAPIRPPSSRMGLLQNFPLETFVSVIFGLFFFNFPVLEIKIGLLITIAKVGKISYVIIPLAQFSVIFIHIIDKRCKETDTDN